MHRTNCLISIIITAVLVASGSSSVFGGPIIQTGLQNAPPAPYDWDTLYGVVGSGTVQRHWSQYGAVLPAGTAPEAYNFDVVDPADNNPLGKIDGEFILWTDFVPPPGAPPPIRGAGASIMAGFDPNPEHQAIKFGWVQTYYDNEFPSGKLDDQGSNFPQGQTNDGIPGWGTHWDHPAKYDIFDNPLDTQGFWPVTVVFETTLICHVGNVIHPIGSFGWSFDIPAVGAPNWYLSGVPPNNNGFGDVTQDWIDIVSGSPQAQGWNIDTVNGCKDIPEPATTAMLGIVSLLLVRKRCRRVKY